MNTRLSFDPRTENIKRVKERSLQIISADTGEEPIALGIIICCCSFGRRLHAGRSYDSYAAVEIMNQDGMRWGFARRFGCRVAFTGRWG